MQLIYFNLIYKIAQLSLYLSLIYLSTVNSTGYGAYDIVACRPVAGQRPRDKQKIQQPLLSNGFANKHVCRATVGNINRGTAFSVRSVPRCYKQDSCCNELIVRQSATGKNLNTEADDIVGIRQQARQQIENTLCVL
jgi:hypothetical protein